MSYNFLPSLKQLVRKEMSSGIYQSEDDLLTEAIAGIRKGLADHDAGRIRSLAEVDAELRAKHDIARDA